MEVKVLGPGCKKCQLLEDHTKKALEELGIRADFEKVSDIDTIVEYGVMSTPALMVDGEVIFSGGVASTKKIKKLLQ